MSDMINRPAPFDQLLTLKEISERVAVSPNHIYKLINRGELPPPIKLGKSSRWSENQLNEWLLRRVSGEVR